MRSFSTVAVLLLTACSGGRPAAVTPAGAQGSRASVVGPGSEAPSMTETDPGPHEAAVRALLEQEWAVLPRIDDVVALSDGRSTWVFVVHMLDRFEAWRARLEREGTWADVEAAAFAQEQECQQWYEDEVRQADAEYAEAESLFAEDPSEDNRENLESAEMRQAQTDSEMPDCDPWQGRPSGQETWLSVVGVPSEGPPSMGTELELLSHGVPLDAVELGLEDLDDDGAPEVRVRYRHALEVEEMRGGEVEGYGSGDRLLVLDADGEEMLEAELSSSEGFALDRAYFADADRDGHPDFIRVRWELGPGCACDEAELPEARQDEIETWLEARGQAFAFLETACDSAPSPPSESASCVVTEERLVHRFDGASGRWVEP